MCLVICKPADAIVSPETLREAASRNKDGFGIAVATGDEIIIEKNTLKPDEIIELVERYKDKPCLLHFRLATNGNVNQYNCHPFRINDEWALVHNGIFTIDHGPNESDTSAFTRWMREALKPGEPPNSFRILGLIDNVLNSSKIAFMDKRGNFVFVNYDKGHTRNKCWYSNHSGHPITTHSNVNTYNQDTGYGSNTPSPPFRGYSNGVSHSRGYNSQCGFGPGKSYCSGCGNYEEKESCISWTDNRIYCTGCIGLSAHAFREYLLKSHTSPSDEIKTISGFASMNSKSKRPANLNPEVVTGSVMATATPKATNLLAPANSEPTVKSLH